MSTISPQGYQIENSPVNNNPFWEYEVEGDGIKSISCVKTTVGDFDYYNWSYTDSDDVSHHILTQEVSNKAGVDGVTFTPSVDASGNISWTNDGGLPNPQIRNIKGPKGDTGATGATGATGPQGPQGLTGPRGPQGVQGPAGAAGMDGLPPEVSVTSITGGKRITFTSGGVSTYADIMNGEDGNNGAAATVSVGNTTTGLPGSQASVTNSGTSSAAVLDFVIPAGAKGDQGQPGLNGTNGVSPEVTVQETQLGHEITITDAEHPEGQTFTVLDGQDGMGTVTVGTTTTGAAGTQAAVTNSGTTQDAILNFTIPQGATGPQGPAGPAGSGTMDVGVTITGEPGTNASVENVGTIENAILNFTIPRGATGATGPQGPAGMGTVTVGTTTTGAAGTNASVTNSGTSQDAVLNFTIPQGAQGPAGADGADGVGVPAGGTAGQVLQKASGTDYDTEWATPSGGGGGSRIVPTGTSVSITEWPQYGKSFSTSQDDFDKCFGVRLNGTLTYSTSAWGGVSGTISIDGVVPLCMTAETSTRRTYNGEITVCNHTVDSGENWTSAATVKVHVQLQINTSGTSSITIYGDVGPGLRVDNGALAFFDAMGGGVTAASITAQILKLA